MGRIHLGRLTLLGFIGSVIAFMVLSAVIFLPRTVSRLNSRPYYSAYATQARETLISSATWELADGVRLEARVEQTEANGKVASTRLTVKNLATNQFILKKENYGFILWMYADDLTGDQVPELVVTSSSGVRGNTLEIFEVGETQTRMLFREFYRVDATFVRLSSANVADILLTTGESGAGPFYTTRFVWRGGQYQRVGVISLDRFRGLIENHFSAKLPRQYP